MDWNDYRREIDEAGFSPDAPRRVALRALAAQQEGKERYMMKATRKPLRVGLIAACVVVLLVVSAMAAAISWSQTVRESLGIGEDPILEYQEYDDGTKTAEGMTLLATVCSGGRMDAYFTLSPIEEDKELTLRDLNLLPRPGVPSAMTSLVDRLDYDSETQTALVRVAVMNDDLPKVEAVEISMSWFEEPEEDLFAGVQKLPKDENGEPMGVEAYVDSIYANVLPQYEHCYGPVQVPVTESEILTAACNVPLECGTAEEVRVGAGFVEICMDTRLPESGDAVHALTQAQMKAIAAAMADATITYTDGHTETISTLPSLWASTWIYANGAPDSCRVQHMLSQMLDLREVESVTLGGVTVPMK